MGDTLKHLKQPDRKHAKPYSREQIYANIETMKQSVPLNKLNARLDEQYKRTNVLDR